MMVDSVRDYAIFMLDPDGHVASWNKGAQRIKGYTPTEIIGQHFSVFYPQSDIASGKPPYELKMAARVGGSRTKGWRLRKDGTAFWANVIITAVRDDKNTLVGFSKVTRDLTERRAAEEKSLADARRVAKAEASNTAKSEFLAAMSHELRTPLNAIGGTPSCSVSAWRGQSSRSSRTTSSGSARANSTSWESFQIFSTTAALKPATSATISVRSRSAPSSNR